MTTIADLKQAYLFRKLPDSDLETIASAAREVTLGPGEYVYKKGDPGQAFYIIAEGKVELIAEDHGSKVSVYGHVSAGGHFGEVSLFTGKTRSLSVRTITRVRLLSFDQEQFETVLLSNPRLHRELDKALAERMILSSKGEFDFGITVEPVTDTGPSGQPSAVYEKDGPGTQHSAEYDLQEGIDLTNKIRMQVQRFAGGMGTVLINGEPGTGRMLAARQIHLYGMHKSAPYIELDLCQFSPWVWEGKLFGYERDVFPYSPGRQLGVFEQLNNGTVVLSHAETLSEGLQKKLYDTVTRKMFSATDGREEQPFMGRIILVTSYDFATLKNESIFIPELLDILSDNVFTLPPLREHKRDILPLANYYLKRYSAEHNKRVTKISPDVLGLLMNYDWPGNLTELANVIHRAVMVTQQDEIVSDQILLGLPKTEGKLLYNLLRIPWVRRIIEHRLYPALPKVLVSVLFGIGIVTLFFGPREPEKNFGLTLSWYVGWPLLITSFFFLPRFWCSICALSVPGKLIQKFIQPARRLPAVITANSSWIMAMLCLVVFWVEVVWNAYESPWLTGMILLTITGGALLFSALFQRYSWCRYICPLGALNAIFSMPSVLELRANRQMCQNQCVDHACYQGTDESPGCPMFRHPYLVDNNKDCILCGRCIKNCSLRSTQLNLRLAPRELWSIQTPRLADSFLIVSLGVIYFILAGHGEFQDLLYTRPFLDISDVQVSAAVTGSLIFWGMTATAWCGYSFLCWLQAAYMSEDYQRVRAAFGYGLIPLVLGGYLAFYMKMFSHGAWRIVPNALLLFGIETAPTEFHAFSSEAVSTFLHICILGGLCASLYATYKIFNRMTAVPVKIPLRHLVLPFVFILVTGIAYLMAI